MYRVIENAIDFAIDEVRYEISQVVIGNDDEKTKHEKLTMLCNIKAKLQEALEEIEPF